MSRSRLRFRILAAGLARLARSQRFRAANLGWAVLVVAYVFGYYAWSDPYDRADADYVISGAVAAVLFAYAAFTVRSGFATLGLSLAAWEAAQKAACGVTFYGPSVEPLCVAQYGQTPYFLLAAGSSLYLWIRRWNIREWRTLATLLQPVRSFLLRRSSPTSSTSRCGRSAAGSSRSRDEGGQP